MCREPPSALGKRIASAVAEVLADASKDGKSNRTAKQHRFWKKSDEPTQQFDFVVIGSGVAGLKYALSVAEHGSVAVVTKSAARESNTNYAQVWTDPFFFLLEEWPYFLLRLQYPVVVALKRSSRK